MKNRKMFLKMKHTIFMAMMSEEPRPVSNDVALRIDEMATEIATRNFDEYQRRTDRGLWLARIIKTGEIFNN